MVGFVFVAKEAHYLATSISPGSQVAALGPSAVVKNIKTDFGATCNGVADDSQAFIDFNTWAKQWQQTNSGVIQLDIPSGSICLWDSANGTVRFNAGWWVMGVKQLRVSGYGATFKAGPNGSFFLGSRGQYQDDKHSARLQSVQAGSRSVTLKNTAQASLFTVGDWALLTGFDIQGLWGSPYGYPSNAHFFEYAKITGVSGATVTFADPLKNTYLSTWPNYNSGSAFEVDNGGPATLYALPTTWDAELEFHGLVIEQDARQTYANARSVTYRDVRFTGAHCSIPTQNVIWQALNSDFSTCNMEVDKFITTIVMNDSTFRMINIQSSSVDLLSMDNSTVTRSLTGTPKKAVISNSKIEKFMPGAYAYGRSDEVICTNCAIKEFVAGGILEKGPNDAGVNIGTTMTNGTLAIPMTQGQGALRWAVPGTQAFFAGRYTAMFPFTVVDVTQDAVNTYVKTNLTGGFPAVQSTSGGVNIHVQPVPKMTCTNCTGDLTTLDATQASAGAPLHSYSKRTYSGALSGAPNYFQQWGKLVSVKINVTKPYTGTKPTLAMEALGQFGVFVLNPDSSIVRVNPTVNLKVAGQRVITPAGVSGTQAGDVITPLGAVWFPGSVGAFIPDITAEDPSVWPSATVEIITDQSFGTVPSSSVTPTAPAVPTGQITNYPSSGTDIIAFGDSWISGTGASTPANNLVGRLSTMTGKPIINMGRGGHTTAQGLARINDLNPYNPKVVIIHLGGNDFIAGVPQSTTYANLAAIIENIHARGSIVLLLNTLDDPAFVPNFTTQYAQLKNLYYYAEVPRFTGTLTGHPEWQDPTQHPNDAGYAVLANLAYPVLAPLLGTATVAPTDTTAPSVTILTPAVNLAAGVTQTILSVTTNEPATCRYSTNSGATFSTMTAFSATGVTTHSTSLGGLTNATSYTQYVKCQDSAGNTSANASVTFSVAAAGDTTAPSVTITAPTVNLTAGVTQTTLSATTNEPATCRYSTNSGAAFSTMTAFTTTGATAHSVSLGGLTNATSYSYYVKCQDTVGNTSNNASVTFAVAATVVTTTPVVSQTGVNAITQLASFWEMDLNGDRIAWDAKGGAHGMYLGKGVEPQTTIFGGGLKTAVLGSGSPISGGLSVPPSLVDTSSTFTFGAWVRHQGSNTLLGKWNAGTAPKSFMLNFNSTTSGRLTLSYQMQNGTTGSLIMPTTAGVNAGTLVLVWFAYDASSGSLKISINGNTWTSVTPASPFVDQPTRSLDFLHIVQRYGSTATMGRTMFWKNYIPTDAERADIYNSGQGRPYTYFNPAGFTAPARPLTTTLQDANFAADANLGTQQGLYWLRPFPLKDWSPTLAAQKGDYVWVRSTDHAPGAIGGHMYLGYSNSPATLPTSWTDLPSDAQLSAADPAYSWTQLETPHLVWNPDTNLFHLYAHAVRIESSNPFVQTTHLYTSPDLATWTWRGPAFPNTSQYNHTGYAFIERRGSGDWIARTLLKDVPAIAGTWSSADGVAWSLSRAGALNELTYQVDSEYQKDNYLTPIVHNGVKYFISDFIGLGTNTTFEQKHPLWQLVEHSGTQTNGDWLQDVRAYKEGNTVYLYAKWSYQEPSTVRLYKGTLLGTTLPTPTTVVTTLVTQTSTTLPPVVITPSTGGGGGTTSSGTTKTIITNVTKTSTGSTGGSQTTMSNTSANNTAVTVSQTTQTTSSGSKRLTATLSPGASGQNVTVLQEFLAARGVLKVPAGTSYGYYGALTRSAVQSFQLQEQIITSSTALGAGNVGPKTLARINTLLGGTTAAPTVVTTAVSATSVSSFAGTYTRTLSVGVSGSDITALQQLLKQKGYITANATGYFGPATLQGVRLLQAAHGIETVGTVGPKTRMLLNSGAVQTNTGAAGVTTTPTSSTVAQPQTTPVQPATSFSVGSKIRTTKDINIRVTAGGNVNGFEPLGTTGNVVGGPTTVSGTTWWQVHFANGYYGWARQDDLSF